MRHASLALAVCLALSRVGFAEEIPKDIKLYLDYAKQARVELIEEKKAKLAWYKRQNWNGLTAFQKRSFSKAMKQLKNDIPKLETARYLEGPKEIHLNEVGEIGIFDADLNMIQVLGPETALMRTSGYGETIMIKGRSTKGLVDGGVYEFMDVFHISGTTTYRTAIGSTNTVLVAERFNLDGLEEYLKPETKRVQKPSAKPHGRIIRIWKDTTGKFSVEASFKSYGPKGVTLAKKDDSEVTVPLARLSDSDKQYIQNLLKRRTK